MSGSNIKPNFIIPNNFNALAGFHRVKFGEYTTLLEVDLNEMQDILGEQVAILARAFTGNKDGFISHTSSYANGVVTLQGVAYLGGVLCTISTINLTVANNGSVYIAYKDLEITGTTSIKSLGNLQDTKTEVNKIVDMRFNEETARRIQRTYRLTLNTSDATFKYVKVGTITNSKFVPSDDFGDGSILKRVINLETFFTNLNSTVTSHINNKSNPHGVTKAQVGLGSVENYGVSTKAESETGTSNVKYMTPLRTKEAIEFGKLASQITSGTNLDSILKPGFYSLLSGSAVNAPVTVAFYLEVINSNTTGSYPIQVLWKIYSTETYIRTKVDATVGGAWTAWERYATVTELNSVITNLNDHINNKSNPHGVTKAQVGLGSVENLGLATYEEAQLGSSNVKYMTPLRTAQALIAGLPTVVGSLTRNKYTALTEPKDISPGTTTFLSYGQTGTSSFNGLQHCTVISVKGYPDSSAGGSTNENSVVTQLVLPFATNDKRIFYRMSGYNEVGWSAYFELETTAGAQTKVDTHANNKSNPHGVTKAQVGLGSVLNYGIATQAESEAGTSDIKYMTPLRTSQAIEKLVGGLVASHIANGDIHVTKTQQTNWDNHLADKSNPHAVTKTQVGLGSVLNYGIATQAEAEAGSVTNKYMTPLLTKQAILQLAGNALTGHTGNGDIHVTATQKTNWDNHLANKSNPHAVTKAQVGLGSVADYGIATQAEAQAGTVDNKYMTPLKVKNAIDSLVPSASTSVAGKVQLVNNATSTSTTQAPTANALKIVMDAFNAHTGSKNNPHDVTTTQVNHLGNYVANVNDTYERYPKGVSSMFVRKETDGWQNYGTVLTVRSVDNGGGATLQIYTPYSDSNGGVNIQFRTWQYNATAWSAWKDFETTAGAQAKVDAHANDKNNPHGVTKAQIGLGNVGNYALATQAESEAGTSDVKYMTPLKTKQAIDKLAGNALTGHTGDSGIHVTSTQKTNWDSHLANKSNPHAVTKSQVGLGNVLDYGLATQAESEAGSSDVKYMTPLRTRQAIANLSLPRSGVTLTSTSDWNTFTTPGIYSVTIDGNTLSTNNAPDRAYGYGVLTVLKPSNGSVAVTQIYTNHLAGKMYCRTGYNNLYWTDWNAIATNGELTAHIDDKSNPHGVTKAQVGLSNVLNYAFATQAEAEAGTSTVKYMSPLLVKQAIDKLATGAITTHTSNSTIHVTSTEKARWNSASKMISVLDTRNDNSPPSYYWTNHAPSVIHELKHSDSINITERTSRAYVSLETIIPWTDNSGGSIKQTAHMVNGAMYRRTSVVSTDTWTAWEKVLVTSDLNAHSNDKSNPHAVTKAQVGLGNVDNTSDINKPVSTAMKNLLELYLREGYTNNNSSIFNETSKVLRVSPPTYTDALKANTGVITLTIPGTGVTGLIKLEMGSSYNHGNATGGLVAVHSIGFSHSSGTTFANTGHILSASAEFMNCFYVSPTFEKNASGSLILKIYKKPGTFNDLWLKVTCLDTGGAPILNNSTLTYADAGNATYNYPSSYLTATSTKDGYMSKTDKSNLDSHLANKSNPHGVTKSQVGLANVDNTSDANKPVSTAQNTAINKAKDDAINYAKGYGLGVNAKEVTDANTANVSGFYRNVDKATTNFPSSTSSDPKFELTVVASGTLGIAQTCVARHENKMYVRSCYSGVWTAWEVLLKTSDLNTHANNKSNPHGVTKSQVGLGNVDNTSDVNKPVSTATQNALNNKADKANPVFTDSITIGGAKLQWNATEKSLDFIF